MLRVTFNKFRCWDNLLVEAPLGSITLIRGNSGSGKSTIFHGIVWCLYGNMRLVTPNHDPKAKTRVVLEMPYRDSNILIIDRQKNPNRLIVTQDTKTYEDDVAQSIIDSIFGSYDIWSVSSYIGQGCRNNFLTASNTGKMEILNKVAFLDDDPSIYIQKIEDILHTTDMDYREKLAVLTLNVQKVELLLKTVDINLALNSDQIKKITEDIETLKEKQIQLKGIQKQRDIDIGILKDLEMQLIKLDQALIMAIRSKETLSVPTLPDGVSHSVEDLMNEISKLQRRDDLEKNIAQGRSELNSYGLIVEGSFTMKDYESAVEKEIEVREQQKQAQLLGIQYNSEIINETIKKYQDILSLQDRLRVCKEQEVLREQIRILEQTPKLAPIVFPDIIPKIINEPDYSDEEFRTEDLSNLINELSRQKGELLSHIKHLEKGLDVIQCPHCQGSLRYQNGKLIESDSSPIDHEIIRKAKSDLEEIERKMVETQKMIGVRQGNLLMAKRSYERAIFDEQQRINELTQRHRQLELEQQKRFLDEKMRIDKLAELMSQLVIDDCEPIPEYARLLNANEIQQVHSIIAKLSTIVVTNPPQISSSSIQVYLKYKELKEKQDILENNYKQHLETIPEYLRKQTLVTLNTWIHNLRGYYMNSKEITNEINRLTKMKDDLNIQIENVRDRIGEDPHGLIEANIEEIKLYEEKLVKSAEAHKALDAHRELTKERDIVVEINQRMNDLNMLRQHATETECAILQQITDQLNDCIQSICSSLFDRDITIGLSLYKTLKTTKHIKPQINFLIGYQGGQFDNINQISGGEGDRISLSLTLALNRLSMSPLIMLDESLASLDLNMKENAIRTIREHTNNTVFVIMHDGIEGIFDNVVNIDDI